jgi:hypothetical protein
VAGAGAKRKAGTRKRTELVSAAMLSGGGGAGAAPEPTGRDGGMGAQPAHDSPRRWRASAKIRLAVADNLRLEIAPEDETILSGMRADGQLGLGTCLLP